MPITQILLASGPSGPPTYTLTPFFSGGPESVDEGSSLTFIVGGTNIPNGIYYWDTNRSGDFSEVIAGSVTVTNNSGSFIVYPTADDTTEGAETFTATLYSSEGGTTLVTSSSVTINDTSIGETPFRAYLNSDDVSGGQGGNGWWSYVQGGAPTWLATSTFSVSAPTYNSITYPNTVTTGNTYDFTAGQYLISPTLVRSGAWMSTPISIDFWFYPTANGIQLLTELGQTQLSANYHTTLLEISGTGNIKARFWQSGGGLGQVITSSDTVNLNQWNHIYFVEDTNGAHTFALNGVATTGLPTYIRARPTSPSVNGIHYAVGGSDTTNMGNTGGFQGKIGILEIRDHVASSTYTDANYLKFFAPVYEVTPAANNVDEGSSLEFTVSGTNIPNGTYYWTIETGSSEFDASSGSFTITSNAGSFTVTPTEDVTTEGADTFTVVIRSGSITGTELIFPTSPITINDTSLSMTAPFSLQFGGAAEGDYLSTPASADWALSTTWTIEFWSRATTATIAEGPGLWTVMCQNTSSGIDIYYQDAKLKVNNGVVLADEPPVGQWTHVALVSDGEELKLYYNGVNQYTGGAWNLGNTTDPLVIGKRGQLPYQYFPGQLAMIRISGAAMYSTNFTSTTTYTVEESGTILFLGTDNPLADLSTYELNGIDTSAYNGGTLYFSKSIYPNLDKQVQAGNTVTKVSDSSTSVVSGAVFTADPDNWGINVSPSMDAITVNFSGARHTVTNTGVTQSERFPLTYTVRQWLGSYDPGGSNGYLNVRIADYTDAESIPVGAKTAIGTVTSNSLDDYFGTPVRQLGIEPYQQIGSGDYFTFVWSR